MLLVGFDPINDYFLWLFPGIQPAGDAESPLTHPLQRKGAGRGENRHLRD